MWHRESGEAVPAWAAAARQRGLGHVRRHAAKLGLADPEAELELNAVNEDDRGVTGVAMRQTHRGVTVYGGSLLVMLDARGAPLELGRAVDERVTHTGTSIDTLTPSEDKYVPAVQSTIYPDARNVETVPALSAAQAIAAAARELGARGRYAVPPKAELVILPRQLRNSGPEDAAGGASLVYHVELFVESETESARWFYFIDARDGHVVMHYDAMERGSGQSLYEGVVAFPSGYSNSTGWRVHCGDWRQNWGWYTWDASFQFGGMEAWDMNDQVPTAVMDIGAGCFWRGDFDDGRWGMPSAYPGSVGYAAECDYPREPAGVEAMFAMMLTWDYFLTRHGWRGIDNKSYRMFSRVHYGPRREVAQWNGTTMDFGDGSVGRPWVSLDTVGHEWTHGIRDSTSRIATYGESGAANESFADIFGAQVEFLANNQYARPDFLIGEDFKTPAVRNMADPPALGGRDHYNRRDYPGYCNPPSASNGWCGIYTNAGIQNKAWYLMAVGGTHPYSRVSVASIGGDRASSAFFKALTLYLYASQFPTLHAIRSGTINGCAANHGLFSVTCDSVRQAWKAVGVPENMIDESWFFTRWQYLDFLGSGPDQSGWAFWADTNINQHCPPYDQPCLDYWRGQVSRAFWDSGAFQSRPDVQASGLLTPGTGRPYDNRQFVRWCYMIYLRRDPAAANATQDDRIGWDFWTDGLNRHGDYGETIRAFLFSDGYRSRFIGMH